jgi:hypothetical protein
MSTIPQATHTLSVTATFDVDVWSEGTYPTVLRAWLKSEAAQRAVRAALEQVLEGRQFQGSQTHVGWPTGDADANLGVISNVEVEVVGDAELH